MATFSATGGSSLFGFCALIFVTVGTQLPFDRLILALDQWAALHPEVEIFAQIGEGGRKPQHFKSKEKLSLKEYSEYFDKADLIVAHVGMGTIIAGIENAKPLVLLPRRQSLGEHRSDHQFDTAKSLTKYNAIYIAEDETTLGDTLLAVLRNSASAQKIKISASPRLLGGIRSFLLEK